MQTSPTDQLQQVSATFVVPHTWPDIKNAEFEVLQRLSRAAHNIGAVMIVTDNDGYPLWTSNKLKLPRHERIDPETIDFMISLHFESPRLLDVYSYYALWQPLDFYDTFGYDRVRGLMLTHSDALSCRSDAADSHARNIFSGQRVSDWGDFPVLFHSPPRPYYAPNITADARLFYVGINWERINSERGRHQYLLEMLDKEDLIDIYGPRKFLGVEPWRGFRTYRGELPFDGQSVVKAVHKAGVCLALSSEAHQKSALMSNRLFEGLAAGAVIIANSNGFIDRYFSDLVYTIDDDVSDEKLFQQIGDILEEVRADPAGACERAAEGQKRLGEMFSLEHCLAEIVTAHPRRRQRFDETYLATASATVILMCRASRLEDVRECLADIAAQRGMSVAVVLICDRAFAGRHGETLEAEAKGRFSSFEIIAQRADVRNDAAEHAGGAQSGSGGVIVRDVLSRVETDYFAFMRPDERWFSDHLATMAKAIEATQGAVFGMAGAIEEVEIMSGRQKRRSKRHVDPVGFVADGADLYQCDALADFGRFLFKTALARTVPQSCYELLDGEEPYLVRTTAALQGCPVASGFVTYVRLVSKRKSRIIPKIASASQRRYVQDAFAKDPRWVVKASTAFVSLVQGNDMKRALAEGDVWPAGYAPPLMLGKTQVVKLGGEGNAYFVDCLCAAEPNFVWIDGDTALLAFELVNPSDINTVDLDLDLVLEIGGRRERGTQRPQHCTVVVNGVSVGYAEVPEKNAPLRFRLPRGLAPANNFRIEILADHAEQVLGVGGQVLDNRYLGLRFHSFALTASTSAVWPPVSIDTDYVLSKGGNGEVLIDAGFYAPEGGLVWMGSGQARLRFRLDTKYELKALTISASGRDDPATQATQKISVAVNDRDLGVLEVEEGFADYYLPVPDDTLNADGHFTVSLLSGHAFAVLDREGEVIDPRKLSAALRKIRFNDPPPTSSSPPLTDALPPSRPTLMSMPEPVRTVRAARWFRRLRNLLVGAWFGRRQS